MLVDYLETNSSNYKELSTPATTVWRNVVIISTDVEKAVFADRSYCKGSKLGKEVLLNKGSIVINSQVGDYSQIGFNTKILYATIGKYCSISWDCSIGGSNHNMKTLSTYNLSHQNHYSDNDCIVGNDVWIGSGVIMLRGISLGNGSVVWGGSVVTHNVLPYEIVAGVPAKHLGWRFEEAIRNDLQRIEWWNFPSSVIEQNMDLWNQELTSNVIDDLYKLKEKLNE